MAVTSQEIKMLGCDADGCEVEAPAVSGVLPAKFEAGLVHLRTLDDEPVEWVACRKTHVTAAALAAKARALAEQTPAPEAAAGQPEDAEPVREDDDNDGERRRRVEEDDLEALNV
jgi:hypothetical protein